MITERCAKLPPEQVPVFPGENSQPRLLFEGKTGPYRVEHPKVIPSLCHPQFGYSSLLTCNKRPNLMTQNQVLEQRALAQL